MTVDLFMLKNLLSPERSYKGDVSPDKHKRKHKRKRHDNLDKETWDREHDRQGDSKKVEQ